jgi:hypothetical protein
MPRQHLLALLHGGDRRSIGRSNAVAALVLKDRRLFAQLIHGMASADPRVRMRAADAAEKASSREHALLKPFKRELLSLLAVATDGELRWHLAQMIPRLPLSRRERARAWCAFMLYLEDRSSIVRTFTMQALADLAAHDPGLRLQLPVLLRALMRTGSAAMKARGRKLLEQIELRQTPR